MHPPFPQSHDLRRPLLTLLLAAACLATSALSAWSQTILYVDRDHPAASDNNPGTEALPFKTIQRGVGASRSGTTIRVKAGTYPEGVSLRKRGGVAGSEVVLIAYTQPVNVATLTIPSVGYVRVEGFEVTVGYILVRGSHHITLKGNDVHGTPDHGILITFGDDLDSKPSRNLTIEDNVVTGCQGSGIILYDTFDSVIRGNLCSGNAGNGIRLNSNARRHQVVGNRLHDNGDAGLEVSSGSDSNVVVSNLSYENLDHGYGVNGSIFNVFDSNVAFGNRVDGLSLEGGSHSARIRNCILVDNGLAVNGNPARHNLYVADSSAIGLSSNYNMIWNSNGQRPIRYLGTQYQTVTTFHAATGHDGASFQSDPKFVNPATGDFHLRAGSKAIDSGDSGGADWPALDFDDGARIDDAPVMNTGIGTIAYADRGALEFERSGSTDVGGAAAPGVALSAAHPNPSRSSVAFALDLPVASRVAWDVLDVQGRRVWTSPERLEPAGRVALTWSGLTDRATAAPSGIYFARVRISDRTMLRRFALMR